MEFLSFCTGYAVSVFVSPKSKSPKRNALPGGLALRDPPSSVTWGHGGNFRPGAEKPLGHFGGSSDQHLHVHQPETNVTAKPPRGEFEETGLPQDGFGNRSFLRPGRRSVSPRFLWSTSALPGASPSPSPKQARARPSVTPPLSPRRAPEIGGGAVGLCFWVLGGDDNSDHGVPGVCPLCPRASLTALEDRGPGGPAPNLQPGAQPLPRSSSAQALRRKK